MNEEGVPEQIINTIGKDKEPSHPDTAVLATPATNSERTIHDHGAMMRNINDREQRVVQELTLALAAEGTNRLDATQAADAVNRYIADHNLPIQNGYVLIDGYHVQLTNLANDLRRQIKTNTPTAAPRGEGGRKIFPIENIGIDLPKMERSNPLTPRVRELADLKAQREKGARHMKQYERPAGEDTVGRIQEIKQNIIREVLTWRSPQQLEHFYHDDAVMFVDRYLDNFPPGARPEVFEGNLIIDGLYINIAELEREMVKQAKATSRRPEKPEKPVEKILPREKPENGSKPEMIQYTVEAVADEIVSALTPEQLAEPVHAEALINAYVRQRGIPDWGGRITINGYRISRAELENRIRAVCRPYQKKVGIMERAISWFRKK